MGGADDVARCESGLATPECELLAKGRLRTRAEARVAVSTFIERGFNPRSRRPSLSHLSPADYELDASLRLVSESTEPFTQAG